MDKQVSIEIVALTYIDELDEWVAICQQRNTFNSESPSGYKKQSFANAYQLTFSEKAEENENDWETLCRGAKEELSEQAAAFIVENKKNLVLINEEKRSDKIIKTYVMRASSIILKSIRTEVAVTIKLISKDDLQRIEPLSTNDKGGVSAEGVKMFPDAILSLKKSFEWLDQQLAQD